MEHQCIVKNERGDFDFQSTVDAYMKYVNDSVEKLQTQHLNEAGIDSIDYKYNETEIIDDLESHVNKTYGQHYKKDELECFDAWIALGNADTTFRDSAIKYLWRYGNKQGKNKEDLMKALHFIMMILHVDHYRENTKVAD